MAFLRSLLSARSGLNHIEVIARQGKLLGAGDADEARQELRKVPARDDSDAGMGIGEARFGGGDAPGCTVLAGSPGRVQLCDVGRSMSGCDVSITS